MANRVTQARDYNAASRITALANDLLNVGYDPAGNMTSGRARDFRLQSLGRCGSNFLRFHPTCISTNEIRPKRRDPQT